VVSKRGEEEEGSEHNGTTWEVWEAIEQEQILSRGTDYLGSLTG
jgi:hypothetical protein